MKTIKERREFLEKELDINFENVSVFPESLNIASEKNCENMIGAVQIPLGIAGPIKISGNYAKGELYLPLATHEAALVASVNRGCKAVTLSGGVNTVVKNVGITRGPVFQTKSLQGSHEFKNWLEKNFSRLTEIAQSTSSHLILLKQKIIIIGKNVFVRFSFDTSDAMGMNMATYATDKITAYIRQEIKIECLSLAGNFDLDKKPSYLNFIEGRGKKVWAEAVIDNQTVRDVLKTTPEKIHKLAVTKCYLGSIVSGSLGFNAHFANIVAAIFLATGQDAAHIVEGSLGITTTDVSDGSLYMSIYLPDLPVGTIGGGTGLPAQTEVLKLLGVFGGNEGKNSMKLAEIIGSAVLAGELSLLASLAEGSLARVHRKLSGHI
ncbi:hydroxymethylglutaryl-CoA reductase (NADPH) [Candidatus Gottesmanbacteria bacterium]|nr:hydroxymethylglutaryl-CoA reductase (NADPH) [Candidatus Gottesmanbacteria bacterium]